MRELYKISIKEHLDDIIKAEVMLNEHHSVFKGHFPGQPVIPGVCLIQLVVDTVNEAKGKNFHLIDASNIKFLNIIDPRSQSSVTLQIRYTAADDNTFSIQAEILDKDIIFFRLKGKLK